MKFGVYKCKLLISARPKKLKSVEILLENVPALLTFYDKPVSLVLEPYQHIGVPQSPRNQSRVIIDQRITKATEVSYMMQDSTKNSLRGISPLTNRKMFNSYYQPVFLYGTDTMQINKTDLDRLETSYRHILKKLMCLPDSVASPAVYLSIGIFPAEAQRDLDIVSLFGQLAVCPDDIQKIRNIIEGNLTYYSVNFHGWRALVRKVCLRYNLPDPLLYMQHPWRPDRWRKHCKETIGILLEY